MAVSVDDSGKICGFGSASSFNIYCLKDKSWSPARAVPVDRSSPVSGEEHRRHIENLVRSLSGCGRVITREIGELPSHLLSESNVEVILDKGYPEEVLQRLSL